MKNAVKIFLGLLLLCSGAIVLEARSDKNTISKEGPGMDHSMMMDKKGKYGHEKDYKNQDCCAKILKKAEKLKLSQEQIKEIRAIKKDFDHYKVDKKDELCALNLKLSELRKQQPVPLAEAKSLLSKIGGVKADMQFKQLESREKAIALFTDDQKSKFKELCDKQKGKKWLPKDKKEKSNK
ncbi:MAG: hypothetical protein ABII74_05290 [Elusimicrobiota bacterium]